jgi:hypothetical protein
MIVKTNIYRKKASTFSGAIITGILPRVYSPLLSPDSTHKQGLSLVGVFTLQNTRS